MSTKTVSTKTRKATKPSQIDYHGFVASTKKSTGNYDANFNIADSRADEIVKLLQGWAPDPTKINVSVTAANIASLPTENERLFASFLLGKAVVMASMIGGMADSLGDAAPEAGDDDPIDGAFPGADDGLGDN